MEENPTKLLGTETIRNNSAIITKVRHETDKNLECAERLNENNDHEFKWSFLFLAPKVSFKNP